MKNLPLNTFRAFAAVYETGGIRPAGRRLGITHSSISRHLRELEAWIGTPLFVSNRQGRSLVFSPEGETLGKSLLHSLSEMEGATTAIRESRRSNSIVISTSPSFAMRWLLPRLSKFEAVYPGIEVSVIVDQQARQPRQNGADIAIRMGSGPWPDLDCHPLMDDRLFLVMSPSFWKEMGKPNRMDQLSALRLLHDRDPNAGWAVWKKAFGPEDLETRQGPRFTSSDLVLRAAERGMGVALAREKMAADDLQTGSLINPFGDDAIELKNAYWIVREKDLPMRKITELFQNWLLAECNWQGLQ